MSDAQSESPDVFLANAYAAARTELLSKHGLDEQSLMVGLSAALQKGGDYADLFLQASTNESWGLDGGRVKRASYGQHHGFGLRALQGEQAVLATSQRFDTDAIAYAAKTVSGAIAQANMGCVVPAVSLHIDGPSYYPPEDPLPGLDATEKVVLLEMVNSLARARDPRVVEVMARLSTSVDYMVLARHDGYCTGDTRPLVRLDVSVHVQQNGRRENATRAIGGRANLRSFDAEAVVAMVGQVVDAALHKLESKEAPAGTMTLVIAPGWNGVMLHEAVGHGLEGDFNRRGSSAFAGRIGQRVAAPGITIVDDGTVPGSRGSINVDDEGTPGQCTTLIEDGILVGYMQDSLNARLSGVKATGNGRRESYNVLPMPRMTNTYMRAGTVDPEEIISSVKSGIYVANLGSGQVDITSGRFVFAASEAFLIENGKLTAPVKGATVLGDGANALTKVKFIGNDLKIDKATGVCGKAGQSVPVGVGQPTMCIEDMTIGGSA
ncbi:metallopeptidase TldD-related protein [Cupriavidus necator]